MGNKLPASNFLEAVNIEVSNTTIETLKNFGLSEYEAKAYIALVALGVATVKKVCEVANIPHPRAYDTLAGLEEKGLVEIQHGRPKVYKSVPPRTAFRRLEKALSRDKETAIEELSDVYGVQKSKQELWTMHGKQNIINRIEEMLMGEEQSAMLSFPKDLLLEIEKTLQIVGEKGVELKIWTCTEEEDQSVILPLEGNIEIVSDNQVYANLLIVDGSEALISSGCVEDYKGPWIGIWTNEPSFTKLISIFFKKLWKEKKLEEERETLVRDLMHLKAP
ncbi:MAG: TrmB family transcriptional regulator [Candidatus Jordarchaeum sp.]